MVARRGGPLEFGRRVRGREAHGGVELLAQPRGPGGYTRGRLRAVAWRAGGGPRPTRKVGGPRRARRGVGKRGWGSHCRGLTRVAARRGDRRAVGRTPVVVRRTAAGGRSRGAGGELPRWRR